MTVAIRAAVDRDLPSIATLFYDAVRHISPDLYTPEQTAAWAPEIGTDEGWARRFQGYQALVAVDGDQVVGFTSISRAGHLNMLFVHHQRQRQGIGSALLRAALALADEWRLTDVHTEASLVAKGLFERFSFEVVEAEDVVRRGVTLRRFRMRKAPLKNGAKEPAVGGRPSQQPALMGNE